MPDQIRFPYGDAFLVQTPALDKYAQNLYIDQRNRELRREQEMKQLDDEFARNVAGIRDADVGDLTKAYGNYKLAYKNLLKRPQGGTPQEQLDVLRKKADVYKVISESKQQKTIEEDIRKGLGKNPDIYEDEDPQRGILGAHKTLFQSIRTPLSQMPDELRNHDYSYKGTDTDLQKQLQVAAGQPKTVYSKEEPLDEKNMQIRITPYSYGNTPLQFKQSIMGSLAKHRAGRDAAAIIAQTPQDVLESIDVMYHNIPKDRWQQMGIPEGQPMSINEAATPQEKYAIHQAQLYALNNLPKQGTPTLKDNKSVLEKSRQDFALRKLAIQHANAADLIDKRHDLTQGDKQLENLWIDSYVDKKTEEAKPSSYFEKGKQWQDSKEVALDPVLENAMRINGKPADFMKVMPNGEYKYGFWQREKDKKTGEYVPVKVGDHYAVDNESVRTITKDGVKLALGKQAGVKQLNMEMSNPTPSAKYSIKGKTYTQKQLTDFGYKLEQIAPYKIK